MFDRFLLVFISVGVLTAVCGASAVAIGLFMPEPAPPYLDRLFDTFLGLFSIGAGAILGLLGGRVVDDQH
jgi:hypothetical protein